VQRPTTSFAGGIATTSPVPEAFAIMQRYVDDMLLVPEASLYTAIGMLVRMHGFVVEGAGAAPVAALLQNTDRFRGCTVVLVLSGRNLDAASLQCALAS
jgi:threonine dehydratase